jgi:glycosyltransferase involved in cell wall biosynthesis
MPKVSVVIASYNHERYVRAAIESVLAQSFQDFEILVTDDGSVDRTVAEVQAIEDPRISLEALPNNGGACAAINATILRSTGDYVAILNSDDVFLPEKLARQVRCLDDNPGIAAVFARPLIIGEDGRPHPNPGKEIALAQATNRPRHKWLRRFFFRGNLLCHPSILIRRRCYDETGLYNTALAQLPDLEMWVRLLREHEIHLIEEPLLGFRIRDNQMNASAARPDVIVRDQWEWLRVLEQYLKLDDALLALTFPEIADHVGEIPSPWLLATMALKSGAPAHVMFALETMYRDVSGGDEARRRLFIDVTGSFDPFGLWGRQPAPGTVQVGRPGNPSSPADEADSD